MAGAIVAIVGVVFLVVMFARTVRLAPPARACIVERLGRYHRTLTPRGDANAVFVIPSQFAEGFGGLGRALGTRQDSSGAESPSR